MRIFTFKACAEIKVEEKGRSHCIQFEHELKEYVWLRMPLS